MQHLSQQLKDLHFTKDHEWVKFQGAVAHIGLSPFKLTGFKKISQFFLAETEGMISAGTSIMSLQYNDYLISLNMPVTARFICWNNELLNKAPGILLADLLQFTWIAKIAPNQPYDRDGLTAAVHYQINGKRLHALQESI
jgi:glycine cleavage system H protein